MTVGAARPLSVPTRDELRAQLVQARIAGDVDTPRDNNLRNYRRLSERNPRYLFGLDLRGPWNPAEVLALMAQKCGVSPEEAYAEGVDTIDPDRTIDRLEALATRVGEAAQRQERVIVATGHPAGLLAVHLEVAAALARVGCPLLTPAAGWGYSAERSWGGEWLEIRYVGNVAMLSDRGGLKHTHSPRPMEAMLAELAGAGEGPPSLVVADHGWAGAAGRAGIDTVGFADSNDPALFVGEAEGDIAVSVPLDDNVAPHLYAPMTGYLLAYAGLR